MWFLNLAYTYAQHCKAETLSDAQMEWQAPFGRMTDVFRADQDNGYVKADRMWGLPAFPSIRFHKDDVARLPLQNPTDSWNCGFGLIAAIAIILRDIVGTDADANAKYFDLFHDPDIEEYDSDPNFGEFVIKMKADCFQPLPKPPQSV